jgi:hypothetical protein
LSPWRAAAIGEDAHSVLSAITCRWTSQQNFTSRLVLEDRFTAANSELALAQPGQQLPHAVSTKLPPDRLLHLETCRMVNSYNSARADLRALLSIRPLCVPERTQTHRQT